MRRTLITEAKRKHRRARAALKKAERKYAALARKYDRLREQMMTANAAVGKASQEEKQLQSEVKYYETALAKLKAKPQLSPTPLPRLSIPKAPPPKSEAEPPKPRKKRAKKKSGVAKGKAPKSKKKASKKASKKKGKSR